MYFLGDFFSPVCLSSCALLISQLILSVQVSRWLWVLHCIVTVIRSVLNAINYLHHRCIVDRDHKYTWFPLSLRTAIITCILPCDYSPFCANTTVEIGCSLPPRKRPPQLISHNSFTSLNSCYYIWTSLAGRSTYVMRTSPVLSLVKDSLCSYFVYRAPLLRREGQWKILLENPPLFFFQSEYFILNSACHNLGSVKPTTDGQCCTHKSYLLDVVIRCNLFTTTTIAQQNTNPKTLESILEPVSDQAKSFIRCLPFLNSLHLLAS